MKSKKNFKFDYDLSGLSAWVKEEANEMLLKDVLGVTLPRYASIRGNIRGDEKVGFLTNDLVFQNGKACGFSPTGDTTIDQVLIQTCTEKINQELCPYELYDYYLSQALRQSNFQEEVPFQEQLIGDIANRMANHMEVKLWQSTTGATPCNFPGVLSLVVTGNGATNVTYTAITASNGVDVMAKIASTIPSNVAHRDDLVIFVSYADYRNFVQALRNSSQLNLFAFEDGSVQKGAEWAAYVPGTNVLVVPTHGLDGQSKMIAGPSSYIQVGMNTIDDNGMEIRAFYDQGEDTIKVIGRMTYGVGIFDIASFVRVA